MSAVELVCASANPDKVAEIQAILGPAEVVLLPRPSTVPEVAEDAPTLEGNARLKAAAICEVTGLPAVADDTGLEVDALGGAPGVRSARYAGEQATYADNVRKLLTELLDAGALDASGRTARFRTVALVRYPDGREVAAEGVVEGVIAPSPRGDAGFGYDPVFVPVEGDGRTFAEMSGPEKHAISHRGRAFRALAARLAAGT
ncbi:RdgB/HAM1 family non-canonical purine NTP pyrophosphatase [Rhabdothermincola sediminis]|uniref:RdgB/HAM1 family non-canonical purine NTP pyrophosphatase n=1 Tax=Rhabdothermincola sediminis TaxID=2751370 RepID=UPI001AA018C6|nr:RdgB/HAM1 family non-canonical purine NTP pyrophosphatase [Rhabdothermincola sediminis]